MEIFFVNVGKCQLRVCLFRGREYRGVPLIWLPGALCDVRALLARVPQVQHPNRDIFVVEPRGHGGSEFVDEPLTWAKVAGDAQIVIGTILSQLSVETFDLGGFSMGAAAAYLIALDAQRIRSLYIEGFPTYGEHRASRLHLYDQLALDIDTSGLEAGYLKPRRDRIEGLVAAPDILKVELEIVSGMRPNVVAQTFRGCGMSNLHCLSPLKQKVHLLRWDDDPWHPTDQSLVDLWRPQLFEISDEYSDRREWATHLIS